MMSLAIRRQERVPQAIQRRVLERIQSAVELIGSSRVPEGDNVHRARKQLKQARALLRLIRGQVGHKPWARADDGMRKTMQALSGPRDATVLVETLQTLNKRGALPARVYGHLRQLTESDLATMQADTAARNERLRKILNEVARQVDRFHSTCNGWRAIGSGIRRIYQAAQSSAAPLARQVECDDTTLHTCRKRVKTLLHALEFLEPTQPKLLTARIRTLHRLSDLLGEDHDLAVLQAALHTRLAYPLTVGQTSRLEAAIAAARCPLQRRARRVARIALAEESEEWVKQLRRFWKQWRATAAAESVVRTTGWRRRSLE
jgi:CHAD domain-containing protein